MGRWVSLKKALMSPQEFGEISKRRISYLPDQGSVQLTKSDTGWNEVQTFSTKMDCTWYPFIHEGDVYLAAGEITVEKLRLYGRIGYENGINSIEKIAKLYGNDSLGAKGIGLTPKIFYAMPKCLRDLKDSYWLCKQKEHKSESSCYFGLNYVASGNVSDNSLYYSFGFMYDSKYAVRPLVCLKFDTEVYIDDSDKPLEIRNGSELAEYKESLPTEDVYSISKSELEKLRTYVTNTMELVCKNGNQEAYTEVEAALKLIERIKVQK